MTLPSNSLLSLIGCVFMGFIFHPSRYLPKKLKMAFPTQLRNFLVHRIPVLRWAPEYNTHKLLCDVIAGVTVGLTVMPQGLAYATLAGLEPQVSMLL